MTLFNLDRQKSIIEGIMSSYDTIAMSNLADDRNLPAQKSVSQILLLIKSILFPGYFDANTLDTRNLPYVLSQKVVHVINALYTEIKKTICKHPPVGEADLPCRPCCERALEIAHEFMEFIPSLRAILKTDLEAMLAFDPAARSDAEIILCYPGFEAIIGHRIAHYFYRKEVPLIPRMMSELEHHHTGIDIHPGARIGKGFAIDHGTGIVIGETSVIGENVKIFQGVTLGGLSVKKANQGRKRHPTIEDGVVIFAGATILGGDTVIGANSTIGGNVWITASVPPDSKIYLTEDKQQVISRKYSKS